MLLIVDSQVVKNTDTASIETKGFCHYKKTNGIKRHLCVDTLGNILFVAWTPFVLYVVLNFNIELKYKIFFTFVLVDTFF